MLLLGGHMEKTSKKLPVATCIIALANVAIFALSFFLPTVALWFAVPTFVLSIALVIIKRIFVVKLRIYLGKVQQLADSTDDADREKHMGIAVLFIVIVFIMSIFLHDVYLAWRKRLLGLLLSSSLSIIIIVYSGAFGLLQNIIAFFHIILIYFFARAFIAFTLNPLGKNKTLNKIPLILKIALESIRIFLLGIAALGRDFNPVENTIQLLVWDVNTDTLLAGVVATMAIDSILVALKKIFPEKDVSTDETIANEPSAPVLCDYTVDDLKK